MLPTLPHPLFPLTRRPPLNTHAFPLVTPMNLLTPSLSPSNRVPFPLLVPNKPLQLPPKMLPLPPREPSTADGADISGLSVLDLCRVNYAMDLLSDAATWQPVTVTTHTSISKTLFLLDSYAPACYPSAAAFLSRVTYPSLLQHALPPFPTLLLSQSSFPPLQSAAMAAETVEAWLFVSLLNTSVLPPVPPSPSAFPSAPPSPASSLLQWHVGTLEASPRRAMWRASIGWQRPAHQQQRLWTRLSFSSQTSCWCQPSGGGLHLVQGAPGSGSGGAKEGATAGAARAAAALDALRNSSGSTGQSHSALEYVLSCTSQPNRSSHPSFPNSPMRSHPPVLSLPHSVWELVKELTGGSNSPAHVLQNRSLPFKEAHISALISCLQHFSPDSLSQQRSGFKNAPTLTARSLPDADSQGGMGQASLWDHLNSLKLALAKELSAKIMFL
ncbi:unnamed protein product [Closterium sp. NIES-65]|nr:unnamed protein product [Closterium sp. NIES-65]